MQTKKIKAEVTFKVDLGYVFLEGVSDHASCTKVVVQQPLAKVVFVQQTS
jgi:hypothetical protein